MSTTTENKMGVLPVKKLIITMSLPMMASMLVQALYNVVDSIFVAQIDEAALTAVTLAFPMQNLMIALGSGTGVGMNALLSRSLGEKRFDRSDAAANTTILLTIINYLIFFIIGAFFVKPFIHTQTDDPVITQYAVEYLSIICFASAGIFFQMTFERMLQSTGRTFYSMISQMTGAVINIIFDPILIFGLIGFPKMGVAGAALATVIGQITAAMVGLFCNLKKNLDIHLKVKLIFTPKADIVKEIYYVGVPSILMMSIGSIMTYAMNLILISFSTTAAAVFGVYFKLQSFFFMPIFGLNNGLIPVLAYNFGAKSRPRIEEALRFALTLAVSIMADNRGTYDTIGKIYDTFAVTSKSRYVYVYDIEKNMSRWSPNAVKYFGLPGEYVYKADQVWEAHIHPEDRETYREHLQVAFSGNRVNPSFEYRARNKNGEYIACSCKGVVIKDYSGKAAFYACSLINKGIIDNTDPISGLANHYEMLSYMHRLENYQESYILLLVNVIDFGDINRLYGYMFGNRMLKSMAEWLLNEVGAKGHVYRGDGTILGVCTTRMDLEEIKSLYLRMRQYVRQSIRVGTSSVSAELSGGVIVCDESGVDVHAVYTSAKYALEYSKNHKHGNLIIFHNNELDHNKSTIDLVNAVRESVLDHCNGFYLNYQPIISKKEGKLVGAEVLLRWKKEPYGDVAPGEFVPWLEQDETFYALGTWVLDRAMKDGLEILKDHPDFYISLNLAYMQLERSEFRTTIVELLRNNRYPGSAMCIELSNVTREINFDYLKSQVIFLKSCGIRIALDVSDFSTLDLATSLPINMIKLGPEITENIKKNPLSRHMADAITRFAENMSMNVCATGVGDAETAEKINDYTIDSYQGYYYALPQTLEAFKRLPIYTKK